MTTLYAAMGNALAIIRSQHGQWQADLALIDKPTQCIAVDPLRPRQLYCGTFGQGLWWSDDAGATWHAVGPGLTSNKVMAVAVSRLERSGEMGVVWAGTEPSMLFRSEDGGQSWQERESLKHLPSAPTWSFPPRPWTHHVRWIEPDPVVAERLYVAIELGGVMRSLDGGRTWEDRKSGAQPDAHTLHCHRLAPGRVYEAAGGGYAESSDAGTTWHGYDQGLPWHYLWGLAIAPDDPDVEIVSVSPGPRHAHDHSVSSTPTGMAANHGARTGLGSGQHGRGGPPPWASYDYHGPEATIYRRSHGGTWQESRTGLPDPRGTLAYTLASDESEPGVFYAAPHEGDFFRSTDSGRTWERLDIAWPAHYHGERVNGLIVVNET